MEKKIRYQGIKYHPRIIRKLLDTLRSASSGEELAIKISTCSVSTESAEWDFDSIDEFFELYSSDNKCNAYLTVYFSGEEIESAKFNLQLYMDTTSISISGPSRQFIELGHSILADAKTDDKIVIRNSSEKPVVFIGHGRNGQWQRLKSHLQDKHGIETVAYETGARSGHTIRDILDSMANESSFALLVLTGEDKTDTGLRARQNVIHECGLFQGRLGFDRAIMLVEQGVELASNFDGIQQLRFKRGRISEVFGDVET